MENVDGLGMIMDSDMICFAWPLFSIPCPTMKCIRCKLLMFFRRLRFDQPQVTTSMRLTFSRTYDKLVVMGYIAQVKLFQASDNSKILHGAFLES